MNADFAVRLEELIGNSADELEAVCLKCELAGYLARCGNFDEAEATLQQARQFNATRRNARVSSWIHIAEGMQGVTLGVSKIAFDRFLRARAIAAAEKLVDVSTIATAWLSFMEYTRAHSEMMVQYLSETLRFHGVAHRSALGRADSVVALAFHFAGRFELARPWYESARAYAAEVGDKAMTSAILHNSAWLHLANARQGLLSSDGAGLLDHLPLVSESASNYDSLIGLTSQSSFVPLLVASTYFMAKRFPEALELYDAHVSRADEQGMGNMLPILLAEQAYCHAVLMSRESALSVFRAACDALKLTTQVDDLAAAHERLSSVSDALGLDDEYLHHKSQAQAMWNSHRDHQEKMISLLLSLPNVNTRRL